MDHTLAPSGSLSSMPSQLLRRLAWWTAGWIFMVLVAGGLVTSTGSGLTVPDWPLSFGRMFPALEGGAWFEHSHRMIAGVGGLLTGILGVWLIRVESRRWVKGLAVAAMAGILLQALLGGLTVIMKLPAAISMVHACLGQTVFGLLVWITHAISADQRMGTRPVSGVWKRGIWLLGSLFIQLVLGSMLRHTGWGVFVHVGWALAVAVSAAVAITTWRRAGDSALKQCAGWLGIATVAQMGLGVIAYVIRWSFAVELPFHVAAGLVTAHVAGGAAMMGLSIWTTLRAYRASC